MQQDKLSHITQKFSKYYQQKHNIIHKELASTCAACGNNCVWAIKNVSTDVNDVLRSDVKIFPNKNLKTRTDIYATNKPRNHSTE